LRYIGLKGAIAVKSNDLGSFCFSAIEYFTVMEEFKLKNGDHEDAINKVLKNVKTQVSDKKRKLLRKLFVSKEFCMERTWTSHLMMAKEKLTTLWGVFSRLCFGISITMVALSGCLILRLSTMGSGDFVPHYRTISRPW